NTLTETGVVGGPNYATTGARCLVDIQVNDVYSYIQGIAWRLVRQTAPDGSPLPVGCVLPLGCKYHPFVADGDLYIGKDFDWGVKTDAFSIEWEGLMTSQRTSNDCDVNGVFLFPHGQEYHCQPRETFTLEATPIAAIVPDDTYILQGALIGYQMRSNPK